MRTARLFPVSPGMHCSWRGCTWSGGCTWSRGCTWSQGEVYLVPGVYLVLGGVPGPRGCTWSLGVYLIPGRNTWPRGCTWSWGEGVYLPRYSPCSQNSWHTLLKILPCPKLRLQAVTRRGCESTIDCRGCISVTRWNDILIFCLLLSSVPFFFSSVTAVFDKGQPLVYTFIPSFIPNMILLKGFHIHLSLWITPCPT